MRFAPLAMFVLAAMLPPSTTTTAAKSRLRRKLPGPPSSDVDCDVHLAFFDGPPDDGRNGSAAAAADDDEALYCETSDGGFEIEDLDPGDYSDMIRDVKSNAAQGRGVRYKFPGASIGRVSKGKRKGADSLRAGGKPERSQDQSGPGRGRGRGQGQQGGGGANKQGRRSLVLRSGVKTVLVMRVSGADNVHVTATADELRTRVFGDETDSVNLAMQTSACSYGLLNFTKPQDNVTVGLDGGVVQINLPQSISGVASGTVRNWVITEAKALLGTSVFDSFDYRMYVLPSAVSFGGAAAWAYVPGKDSVYLNGYASQTWVQMHEVGHNLGLLHSGENGGGYGDSTGYMGAGCYSCPEQTGMCFNAQKSSYLEWYADREITLAPNAIEIFDGRLIGIADYGHANTNLTTFPSPAYKAIIRVDNPSGNDLFLTYNDADGINTGTMEKQNLVTVVEGENDNISRQSWLRAGLAAGEEYVSKDWAGTFQPFIMSVSSMGTEGAVDFAQVTATLGTCTSSEQCILHDSCRNGFCNGAGVCEESGPIPMCCGNSICESDAGETCGSCPQDCCSNNLAQSMPAEQSSLGWGGVPERAVDGNTNGVWNVGSVTHTQTEFEPWWIVDLGSEHLISNVIVYNRVDCCSHRLQNFNVDILDATDNTTFSMYHSGQAPAMTHFTLEDPPGVSYVRNRDGATGRYVRIQLIGRTDPLSLAEVQVFAAASSCGDGVCDAANGETCATCASDCCEVGALLETWYGYGGNGLSVLTGSASFPDSPDETMTILNGLEAPTNRASNFGSLLRTYIVAPETGNYTFWIASDDNGELYLSPDTDPESKVLIANVPGWTSSKQWNKYAQQKSTPQNLVKGGQYYLEALYKEGGGGDNLAIAWESDAAGITQQVIGGGYTRMFHLPTESPSTAPTDSPETSTPTMAPETSAPTMAPETSAPTMAPETSAPTMAPETSAPTMAPETSAPTMAPETSAPTMAPETSAPTMAPETSACKADGENCTSSSECCESCLGTGVCGTSS